MTKGWGSLIVVVMCCVLIGSQARADFLDHPWAADYAPLPVTTTVYTPPEWLNNCPVAVAGDSVVATTTNCLPSLTRSVAMEEFEFDTDRRLELENINTEVNGAVLSPSVVTLEQAIAVATMKMTRAVELGFPTAILHYAIVEAPMADEEDEVVFEDHFVLVVTFGTRVFVLDSMLDDIVAWQYSPHRFYAIEMAGEWRAVADDRDDPLAMAIE